MSVQDIVFVLVSSVAIFIAMFLMAYEFVKLVTEGRKEKKR